MKHTARVQPAPTGLVQVGPLVEVTLTPHQAISAVMVRQGHQIPAAVAKMMVDTGAQRTLVDKSLADALGVPPIRFDPITGVSGIPENYPVYPLSVTIGFEDHLGQKVRASFNADIVGMPSPAPGCRHNGLLGRDFLQHFELFYDGPRGVIEIRVPDGLKAQVASSVPELVPARTGPPEMTAEQRRDRRARTKRERKARKKNR